jgi:hypothetical protein
MGRTSFNSLVPRFYTYVPSLGQRDWAAANAQEVAKMPWQVAAAGSSTAKGAAHQGMESIALLWSVQAAAVAGTTYMKLQALKTGTNPTMIGGPSVGYHITPVTGAVQCGVALHGTSASATGVLNPGTGYPTSGLTLCNRSFRPVIAAGDTYTGFNCVFINTPSGLQAVRSTTLGEPDLVGTATAYTHFPGPTFGGYVMLPFPEGNLADSEAAYVTVRKWTVPQALRAQEVTFGCHGSGAANLVRLYNSTQGVVIAGSALASAITVTVTGANLAGRNIARNDVLELQCITGVAGFTEVFAGLCANTRGHINTRATIDYDRKSWSGDVGDVPVRRTDTSPQSGMSGPCTGGILCLYIPGATLIANQASTKMSSFPCPVSGEIIGADYAYVSSAAANTLAIVNDTQAANVVAAEAAIVAGDAFVTHDYADITTPLVDKGDVLSIYGVTGATDAITQVNACIYIRVTGHTNPNPSND